MYEQFSDIRGHEGGPFMRFPVRRNIQEARPLQGGAGHVLSFGCTSRAIVLMPTLMPTEAVFGDTGRNRNLSQTREIGLFTRLFRTARYKAVLAAPISESLSPGSNPGPAAS